MDTDERLTALKRAYADIILNTAKEAAARIMVSERKVLRFQQELNVAKEQALQMLLRLKQMMDSKVTEAEVRYLSQQRKIEELEGQLQDAENTIGEAEAKSLSQQGKIEELESQLQEAEDIVKDVREELREVQAELGRVRNKKLHDSERDTAPQPKTTQENGLHASQSIVFPPLASQLEPFTTSDMKSAAVNQQNEVYKCFNANDYHAGAGNFHIASDMKSSAVKQRNEVYKCHIANDFLMGNSYVNKPDLPSIILRNKEPEPFRNRRTQRIRAFEEKLMAGELAFSETVDDVNYETSGKEDGEGEGVCKTPTHKADNMCISEKNDVVQADSSWHQVQKVKSFRRKRARATRYRRNKTPSPRYFSDQVRRRDQTSDISCRGANSINYNAQSCGDPFNMARSSADATDRATLLKCTKVAASDTKLAEAESVHNTTNENQESTDKLLSMRPVSGSAEDSIGRMDVEKVDVPVVNSEDNTSGTPSGIPNQPVADRVIKYTFQRKRKKEFLSSSDGNANFEKTVLKKKTAEKMEKPSLTIDSSRDSRRVAQVARQLISLSEKKWWQ
ncbi:Golgin subfamily A member 6-like protein [Actinidia chinensis var. chinensis]|uniref:Golgin subfamily A member 6-like protein n=1 Tax=Actinidia chinensis var. chinensis TaxID=1590841 RepID=A0A2R6PDY9_ACTCC|nr:Golgin subfamily A member 6-like protein [Actinidia chinensis var. chinensis]